MKTQELITNSVSTESSIREQLKQEIEQTPDKILEIVLDFILFLKSRHSHSSTTKQPPSTAASILKTLESIGTWEGNDFDECLELVHQSRSKFYITTEENENEDWKVD
ncbi:MAG: DUF2281 domain-containing protein [Symploca sp. SIO2G7]|nr:DUF2281 domain-containing protein [Symploca sp. SIO2G7]